MILNFEKVFILGQFTDYPFVQTSTTGMICGCNFIPCHRCHLTVTQVVFRIPHTQVTFRIPRMSRVEEYKRHATECGRLAQVVQDPDDSTQFMEMAAIWLRLAEVAEKHEHGGEAAG
jgi:hypothetical protein